MYPKKLNSFIKVSLIRAEEENSKIGEGQKSGEHSKENGEHYGTTLSNMDSGQLNNGQHPIEINFHGLTQALEQTIALVGQAAHNIHFAKNPIFFF